MDPIKFEVGKRYVRKKTDGTIETGSIAKTLDPKPIEEAEALPIMDLSSMAVGTKEAAWYKAYYARMLEIAIPFTAGLELKTNHPCPISYKSVIYECIQGHKTQSDWTPDIVPNLFSVIQAPTPTGYPAWVQKFAAPYYRAGDRVTHKDKNWLCTAGDTNGNNVWEPGGYGWTVF